MIESATPSLSEPTSWEIRAKLQELVRRELLGPAGGEEEEVDERGPLRDRYLAGTLAPRGAKLAATDDDDIALGSGDEDDGEATSPPDAKGPVWLLPSSFGLSFMVDEAAESILVAASWGRYVRTESDTLKKDDGSPRLVWKRVQMGGTPVVIPLREYPEEIDLNGGEPLAIPDPAQPEVHIAGRIRKRDSHWFVTLFLENSQAEPQKLKDTAWLFQTELEVAAPNNALVFVHRTPTASLPDDQDEREAAMLYRDTREFASGHGVAVHVDRAPGDPTRAGKLTTCAIPNFEVPKTEAPVPGETGYEALAGLVLDMKTLSIAESGQFGKCLSGLPDAYADWIDQRRLQTNSPDLEEYRATALASLAACDDARQRIADGIALLDRDPVAADAFRFANRAMHLQRVHTKLVEARRKTEDPASETFEAHDLERNRSWRPFQLAFILTNLASLTDVHHPDRAADPSAAADLLWFPTGGGKTEAYLGLTAYTLAIRRLQGEVAGHDGENGVAVVMRYTLRLLTLQQFQRATALICACETIRRENPMIWGKEPFRIGLWVGKSMTPNWTDEAEKAISGQRGGGFSRGTGNPHQLTYCPWCGAPIERSRDILVSPVARGLGRTWIFCGDKLGHCDFSRKQSPQAGLPVLVVDEEIYRNPPSLLIATVDKFAQMPWKGAVQNLFGRVDLRCERHGFHGADLEDATRHNSTATLPVARTVQAMPLRPPDLIIQDELHLISGPLGTMVGLYETAVDALCSWEVEGTTVRPKIIASTATIRRAPAQIHDLFLRSVNVFPPNGLDAGENFFSVQRQPSPDHPGRLYLGICARGNRLKSVLIRVYVALLASAQVLYNDYGAKHVDPYMTLVGYFGALRELGGMRRLVDDDVAQRIFYANEHGLAKRNRPNVEELTSRLGSSEIPAVLDQLGIPYDRKGEKGSKPPIDVLLATNMISVGVDVPRLGLMAVTGQPKNTAEYIQATSRVGREYPGLVVTIYNWNRPRDLSHYEGFEYYHATLYRQVEPLSVTPFAPRALDRGLSSLLASLVRLDGPDLAENSGAGKVNTSDAVLDRAIRQIIERAVAVTRDPEVETRLQPMLDERRAHWQKLARGEGGSELAYEQRKDSVSIGLLSHAEDEPWRLFTALSSLRNVEPGIGMILREYGMEDDGPTTAPLTEGAG